MPPASAPTLCTIPAASSALDPEFLRVLRMADPGVAVDGALTFAPPAGSTAQAWLAAWHAWRDGVFAPHLAPAMVAVAAHAERGEAREIEKISRTLQTVLDPAAAKRSALAGGRLLGRLGTSRGERWLGKLQAGADAGGPMEFPVIYAAQSALFHLPLRLLLPGYAYWEWTAARASTAPAEKPGPDFPTEIAALQGVAEKVLSSRECHADYPQAAFGGS